MFRKNAGPSLFGFRVSNSDGTGPAVLYNGSYITSGTGIAISPLQVTVNSTLFYDVAVGPGETFDLSMIMYAASIASASTGLVLPSVIRSDFYATAHVLSIQAYDAGGPLTGGTLFSASAVPEPSTFALAAGGAALFFLRRRAARS